MASTLRFLRQVLRPAASAVAVSDLEYRRGDEPLPATLYRPTGRRGRLPAWVVLHGLTCRGRGHPSLDRFAMAVAASGALVLVPEIPEWKRLLVAPAAAGPSIAGAIAMLRDRPGTDPERIGVLGFSFGATQAIAALSDPALAGRVHALVAWGGYYDLHNLFRFGFTGEHELDGATTRLTPDPYGAWLMGANYLTGVAGHERDLELMATLRALAEESGRRGLFAGDPSYDRVKARLREGLPPAQRETFDLFAPRTDRPGRDLSKAGEMVDLLANAALAADPLLDPKPHLPAVRTRTLLAHGRDDRLVPYSESVRMARALPVESCAGCTITALFAHSGGAMDGLGPLGTLRETARFIGLLRTILGII